MFIQKIIPSWLLAVTATAPVTQAGSSHHSHHSKIKPQCSSVSFKFSVTNAENLLFNPSINPNNETEVTQFINFILTPGANFIAGTQNVSGNFQMDGVYCSPPKSTARNVLQILVHGATYNKSSWQWTDLGERYDYPLAATREGYATLAIDRLSHGTNPDKPDPLNVVQPGLQIELLRQLITTVRTSSSNPLVKKFKKVVWVGHSWGSMLGIGYARLHGTDPAAIFDAFVATGVSSQLNSSVFRQYIPAPASRIYPDRFGSLPAGYLAYVDKASRVASFYSGEYDPAIPQYDFDHADFTTVGEFGGVGTLLQPAPHFKKPTIVVTGSEDVIFCVQAGVDPKECDKILEKTRTDLFPDVPKEKYEYFAPRRAGHDQSLHKAAPEVAKRIHKFLNKYF
ncbi:Alpha/Beta hydrolase protein [Podospora fimiseda]|uniref:Alpha/Beta hydrolase protein n=1 Tax=Podospora fimiseda TaxID=252190 RepID=A0AAN6YNW7_9PEZI|nr:Alpha/Beta hydrolase protein [Podospora fimiseda]